MTSSLTVHSKKISPTLSRLYWNFLCLQWFRSIGLSCNEAHSSVSSSICDRVTCAVRARPSFACWSWGNIDRPARTGLVRARDNGRGAGWQWAILDSPALEKVRVAGEWNVRAGGWTLAPQPYSCVTNERSERILRIFISKGLFSLADLHSFVHRSLGSVLSFVQNRVYGICILLQVFISLMITVRCKL